MSFQGHARYPELMKFALQDVKRSNHVIGTGSFGSVEELVSKGTKGKNFAGKFYYESSLYSPGVGTDTVLRRFTSECQLLSRIHHLNLVAFVGVFFLQDHIPALVMEQMSWSLEMLLNNTSEIQLNVKLHILHEVAKGLTFLHSNTPPLVHRDLTSNNVLLSEDATVVKIADFRNVSIVDPEKVNEVLLTNQVALSYMPPEATTAHPEFGPPLDIFSFGHLSLYTVLKRFPGNLLPKFCSDLASSKVHIRTELDRRKEYIDTLKDVVNNHSPIVDVIKRCLEDLPYMRY